MAGGGQGAGQPRPRSGQSASLEIGKQLAGRVGNSHVATLGTLTHGATRKSRPVVRSLGEGRALLTPDGVTFFAYVMSYSDRLLAYLNRRGYVPASADAIAKRCPLNPKDRRNSNQQAATLAQSARLAATQDDRRW